LCPAGQKHQVVQVIGRHGTVGMAGRIPETEEQLRSMAEVLKLSSAQFG
jgi:hypothetical protein